MTITVKQSQNSSEIDLGQLVKRLIRLAVFFSPPEAELRKFAEKHCGIGIEKVKKYLHANSNVAIDFPLMLETICDLANKGEEIPHKLSSLYDCVIWGSDGKSLSL